MISSDYVLELSNVFYSGQVKKFFLKVFSEEISGGARVLHAETPGKYQNRSYPERRFNEIAFG